MINKNFKRLIFTLLLFVFFMQSTIVHAEIKNDQIVESTKVWTIKFSNEIVLDEVNKQSIKVIDSKGNIVTGTLTLGQDNKSVLVNPPSEGYIAGEKYILNIENTIHSKNEKKMKTNTTMNFSIKDNVTVNSELTAKQIVGKYGSAVVYIEVSDENHKPIASGSGFIVNSNGIVVTNFHVIKGCSYATITLQNGMKYDVKSVLNYNEKQDIAILQLSNATNLSVVKLGDSNMIELGDNVVAIGSPNGLENTLSTGIISGINRKNSRGNDFQTTASITHGSSGGALFDIYGNVMGITYAGYDSAGDIGFVIPINEVKPFLNSTNETTLLQIKGNLNLTIDSVTPISITKKIGDAYTLPTKVSVTLYDGTSKDLVVIWDNIASTRAVGNYKFIGTLIMADGVVNPNNLTITATLRVSEADITTKFFPLLSSVPQPKNISYYKDIVSSDNLFIGYVYLPSSLPDDFIDTYCSLLENNGWEYIKDGTNSYGEPYLVFGKGDEVIIIGIMGDYLAISGYIH